MHIACGSMSEKSYKRGKNTQKHKEFIKPSEFC